LLISEDGANLVARVTPIAFSASGKIWVNNHAHVLEFETYEDRKFIEYYLNMIDLSRFFINCGTTKIDTRES
jgi:type I restriction enzyme S subunit